MGHVRLPYFFFFFGQTVSASVKWEILLPHTAEEECRGNRTSKIEGRFIF